MNENVNSLQGFLSKLHGVKNHGSYHQANCPAHEDDKASLSIGTGKSGKVLLYCHAGCTPESILAAMGMKWDSLFCDSPPAKSKPQILQTYDYQDGSGKLLFQTVRFFPKDFKQRRPDGKGAWIWNLQGVMPVLYRLPEVLKADQVFIVEGEKDADNLGALGITATTSPMGAGKWKPRYNEYLRDKQVVVSGDNDGPGRAHAESIAKGLKGIASVKVIDLPGLKPKGDISDWLQNGGTKEKLLDMVKNCTEFKTKEEEPDPQRQDNESQCELEFTAEELQKAAYSEQDGDAAVFIKLHRDRFCFDHAAGAWFERSGHYWTEDTIGEVIAAIDGLTGLYEKEAARFFWLQMKAAKEQDEKAGQKAEKHLKAFRRKIGLLQKIQWKQSILQLAAAGRHSLGIVGDEWDQDPAILPFINGIMDLRTGDLRPGHTNEYIKTICPHECRGLDIEAPVWDGFIRSLFNDDELPAFMQRLFGSALFGRVIEHVLPILTGPGRNGKGTLLEALKHALGPLAGPVPSELLLKQSKSKDPDAPSASLMALRGKRIVWASETERGRHFNTQRVKWLCGGDTIVGRDPFGRRQVEFSPTHSIFLLTNDRPRANASDFAFWSRVLLIPFQFTFVDNPQGPYERKRDPHRLEKLKAEAPGILAWLVRGCLEWQKHGLNPPEIVRCATEEYRQGEDQLARFLIEACTLNERKEVKSGDLFQAYRKWCDGHGERAMGGRTFGEEMGKKFDSYRKGSGIHYIGLVLWGEGESV